MIADLDQLERSNQTELEKNGEHFEFKAPVTEAVSIGNTIIVGFGDGKIRFFKPDQKPHDIQAHSGVILLLKEMFFAKKFIGFTYLILPSLKSTCFLATGSYFFISIFSVMVLLFFFVT